MNAADRNALIASAERLSTTPLDLGTVISFKTGGTFSPSIQRGGSGTRLGPASRESMLKQFAHLVDPDQSTFQATVRRDGGAQPVRAGHSYG